MEGSELFEMIEREIVDTEWFSRVTAADDAKHMQEILREKEIVITDEEAKEIFDGMKKKDELNEDELDQVAGGFVISGGTVVACCCVSFGVGFLYQAWKTLRKRK